MYTHTQVFHPVSEFYSLKADDILLWKDTAKQVHEVLRRERGEHFEPCMKSAGLQRGADAGIEPLCFHKRQKRG